MEILEADLRKEGAPKMEILEVDLRKEVLPKCFVGEDICAYYECAWKQKLGMNLLQLSISELWACRKINCEHVGIKKKWKMCTVRYKM